MSKRHRHQFMFDGSEFDREIRQEELNHALRCRAADELEDTEEESEDDDMDEDLEDEDEDGDDQDDDE